MPIQEKYSLTWPSYPDQMKVMMKELMTSGDFADVTLVCDDKQQIRAHKNILAACSPVLKYILQIENDLPFIPRIHIAPHGEFRQ